MNIVSRKSTNSIYLGPRLAAAGSLVREGCTAADIGCDHGKLSVWLIESGRCSRVIASDINADPLQKAAGLIKSRGLSDRISTVLADGIPSGEPDDYIIAGLGPDVTFGIIDSAPFLKEGGRHLILVPSSHHEKMRSGLYERGWRIDKEVPARENGRLYTAILAVYSGNRRKLSPEEAELGLISPSGSGLWYYRSVRKKLSGMLKGLLEAENSDFSKAEYARRVIAYIDERTGNKDA